MLKQFPAEQTDEIDAVISYFGEEFVSVDQSGSELSGIISVVLEPKAKPIVLSAADGTDYGRFETTQLSPIDLHFRLPVEYPDKEAIFDVYSIWLPDPMRTTILKRLAKIAQENLGFPVLFLCCEDVKKFVEEEDMTEVFLGRNNYARKHNLRPMEILERAREECERAELREFEAHCYDCNVCFENKTGNACVRFSPCGHTFCKECVSGYLNERLNSQEVSAIKCLCSKCESPIHQKLIIELAGQEAFDRYERILLSRALCSMGDVATCPRVVCQKPAAVSKVTQKLATCLVCSFSFCIECQRAFHGLQPCPNEVDIPVSMPAESEDEDETWGLREVTLNEYLRATSEERLRMSKWYGGIEKLEAKMEEAIKKSDYSSFIWVQKNSRKCPQCSIPIQKAEGCNNMVCTMCDTLFCYKCGEIISRNITFPFYLVKPHHCSTPQISGRKSGEFMRR